MISGNTFNIIINTINNIGSPSSSSSRPRSSAEKSSSKIVSTSDQSHTKLRSCRVNELKIHDYHKSTKSIYGSSCVTVATQQLFFNLHTNIIMLVEMLAIGLPFVGWRVKPDPGD